MDKKREFYKLTSPLQNLFGNKTKLLPSVDELFEIELAYLEYNSLEKDKLLDRLAYFESM